MTGERIVKCKEHSTTGADSCPDCNKELGIGMYEDRVLRIKLSSEVAYLKGLQLSLYGDKLENQQDSTEIGWDEELQRIKKALKKLSNIETIWTEWE